MIGVGWYAANFQPPCSPHPDCKIAIINVYDLASNRHLGRHPAGNERGAVDDQDAVRWMRDLKIGEVAGADFVEIAPLVVVVAFGMRVDKIIRTKCVEDGGCRRRAWPGSACPLGL